MTMGKVFKWGLFLLFVYCLAAFMVTIHMSIFFSEWKIWDNAAFLYGAGTIILGVINVVGWDEWD